MTTTEQPARHNVRDAVIGVAIGLGAHAVVIGLALLAGTVVEPSPGNGWEDLVAVITALLVGEVIVALSCIVVGTVLIVRGRRALGMGLLAAWLAGFVPVAVQAIGV